MSETNRDRRETSRAADFADTFERGYRAGFEDGRQVALNEMQWVIGRARTLSTGDVGAALRADHATKPNEERVRDVLINEAAWQRNFYRERLAVEHGGKEWPAPTQPEPDDLARIIARQADACEPPETP